MRATNLGQLHEGSEVNFERCSLHLVTLLSTAVSGPALGDQDVLQQRFYPFTSVLHVMVCQLCLHEVHDYRSARMGDEIGGHHVSGHVHTTGKVTQIEDTENNKRITFQVC